ncbi:hypothetical protein PEX1_051030 [Penicillium expansum]|uniref:Uncharacterized protein n=1 Tax=Penicillium expansum TaxID=27334 RepID=A0A0A2KJG2_PENEN|nr:hypothetical protein PEX2_096810 [Penicillium expansum]KGO40773.1 hypothetical protein PEXP_085850 [Penicillium expansum]KGO51141.1 hypothetical protein PEX2_096810 [Penicillium expansum]KGO64490.1 hypothetical protein PEX1_051030 [Penicillium expansum]
MERLFPSFMRVLRDLDDADVLLTTFQEFESNPSATSAEDRIRFLDFPAATTLSKQELLKKAAQSPQELTFSEVELLYNRYWGRISFREESIRSDCFDNLKLECLESFRTSFHAEYEADALKNAEAESSRRYDEMREAQDKADLAHIFEHGYPWLHQLWQEDEGKRPWGYAIFESPQWILEDPERQETYDLKQTNLFYWAHVAIGSGIQIGSQWYLESLDLPSGTGRDKSFMAILHQLRKQFNRLRSLPPKKQAPYIFMDMAEGKIDAIPEGITEGILRNVFLYLDHDAAASVLDLRGPDDTWIWAVDPDYDLECRGSGSSGYQGFLRVRLQQLLHHFYVARRWHSDEWSMEDIWKAAQKDPHNGSFVSMKDEEIYARDSSREVAAAIKRSG